MQVLKKGMVICMKFMIKHNKLQIVIEAIALIILISMFVLLIVRWDALPDRIPGHYNAAREVDRWGGKGELIFLPVMSVLMYLLLTVVTFFPSSWNMPVEVTEEKRDRVYSCVLTLLVLMKAEVMALFAYLNYKSMEAQALSPFMLPIVLAAIFGTIIFFTRRSIKLAKTGD